jgi:hypothetical protein
MRQSIKLIQDERDKQVEKFGTEGDDKHSESELVHAAMAYCQMALTQANVRSPNEESVRLLYWPWGKSTWRPEDRTKNLVKAAALIAAEIERTNRSRGW